MGMGREIKENFNSITNLIEMKRNTNNSNSNEKIYPNST